MKNIKKKKGFTLIEIIIVIAIIGILAAIAVPKLGGIQKDAKIKADIATAKTIADATLLLYTQEKLTQVTSETKVADIVGLTGVDGLIQKIPVPQVKYGGAAASYYVTINTGLVKVYAGNGTKYLELYPESKGTDTYEVVPPVVTPVVPSN